MNNGKQGFPPSKQGRPVDWAAPNRPPPDDGSGDFDAWVDYYTKLIGKSLEQLNAEQFDSNPSGTTPRMQQILAQLRKELNPANPPTLDWPFDGKHEFEPLPPKKSQGPVPANWAEFSVTCDFELNQEYKVVTNVLIVTEGTSGPSDNSSSSYLATSSS